MITEYQTAVNAIEKAVNKNNNPVLKVLIKKFARALWLNYLNEKSTNTTYWYDQFKNPDMFNKVMFHLCNSGWVTSIAEPTKNWAECMINETKVEMYYTKPDVYNMRV